MSESMGTVAVIRLVTGREISTRLRSKSFRITTVVNLVVVVGFLLAMKLIGGSSGDAVGFTPSAEPLSQPLAAVAEGFGNRIKPSTVDQATGENQVREGKLDAFVTGTPEHFEVVVKQDLSPNLRNAFTVLARQLALNAGIARAGGDPAAVNAAADAARPDVRSLEPARDNQGPRMVLAIIAGILVYVSIMIYGQLVAQGVVEEKASRIVEILLSTIRPWQLMLGKVVGIGTVGLIQLGSTAVVGVGAGLALDAFHFPTGIVASAAAWAVLWFLLGYLAYALLFAALGALVSRQEEVGGATAPALMAIILPYVLAISILPADPENQAMAIASQVPFFAPMIMPMRIALGVAPAWQIALSLVLTVALIAGLVWFAGRVYHNAVLRVGARIKLTEALSAR
ncbi:ABC transporter permease [Rhizomonospora bruguierae]|uniref:ABC transporter permease n=1 Tax=Rhizomonospora bruguierae TaxID=1581705 RepID=UPI001BCEDC72|nr:ABC transporter permease [Micromonospora sp. NBRC 107566]